MQTYTKFFGIIPIRLEKLQFLSELSLLVLQGDSDLSFAPAEWQQPPRPSGTPPCSQGGELVAATESKFLSP